MCIDRARRILYLFWRKSSGKKDESDAGGGGRRAGGRNYGRPSASETGIVLEEDGNEGGWDDWDSIEAGERAAHMKDRAATAYKQSPRSRHGRGAAARVEQASSNFHDDDKDDDDDDDDDNKQYNNAAAMNEATTQKHKSVRTAAGWIVKKRSNEARGVLSKMDFSSSGSKADPFQNLNMAASYKQAMKVKNARSAPAAVDPTGRALFSAEDSTDIDGSAWD